MRIAIDTNVIVYAEGINDPQRQAAAKEVLSRIPRQSLVVSVQALGELFNVLTRRSMPREVARGRVAYWREALSVHDTSSELMNSALDLATDNRLSIWDTLILAAAGEARCDLLLSEDFQPGFTWRGVTVVNPFVGALDKRLANLLQR